MSPVPLQLPGGPELLVIFVIGLFLFVLSLAVAVGAAYWVYNDATRRGRDDAALWALGVVLGFLVGGVGGVAVLLVYVFVREE
ncbi:MAG: hypothetical protein ABEJ61_04070 [Haloferacaceae archaeon]